MIRFLLPFAMLACPALAEAESRILSIGGATTEIVYALGQQDRLIARDSSSTFPEEAVALPDVGYMRRLAPEGVLSMSPDLILAQEGAGPPETMDVLTEAAIPVIVVPDDASKDGILAKIDTVGAALGAQKAAAALAADTAKALDVALAHAKTIPEAERKRVMFVLSMQGGRVMAAGGDTGADAIISLAGGVNALDGFDGYKPVSDEAILAAAPDAILMMDRVGDHDTTAAVLWSMPGFAATPAAAGNALIKMDGLYLLGFGPRTAQAALDLSARLYAD